MQPPTRQQPGWLKNLSSQVASWLDQPDQPTRRQTQPPESGTTNALAHKPPEAGAVPGAVATRSSIAKRFTDDLNGVKLEMVYLSGGKFMMGSRVSDDEKHPHKVTVPTFYIGKFQVTQAQWKAVMGDKLKPHFKGDDLPMESVSWEDAKEFCQKLQQMTNKAYRLPTEAEWEYACRAGTTTEFAFGDSLSSDQANFNGEYPYGDDPKSVYRKKTTPVGSFKPNAFGLYDMHGNVWEWCEDVRNDNQGTLTGASSGLSGVSSFRVLRGGSWWDSGLDCRSAVNSWDVPDLNMPNIGFRVVVSVRTSNP